MIYNVEVIIKKIILGITWKQIYRQPVINAMQASKHLEITPKYTYALIDDFMKLGILKETTGQRRNRIFVFGDYLNCFM